MEGLGGGAVTCEGPLFVGMDTGLALLLLATGAARLHATLRHRLSHALSSTDVDVVTTARSTMKGPSPAACGLCWSGSTLREAQVSLSRVSSRRR